MEECTTQTASRVGRIIKNPSNTTGWIMELEQSQDRALQVHLADFENCNKRIEHYLGTQAQLINISIGITAGVVSIATLENNIPIRSLTIFLIGSLIMASLCWALAETGMQTARLYEYVETALIPKIQILMGRDHPAEFTVLSGENKANKWNILAGGKHGISYIAGFSFLLAFLFQKVQLHQGLAPLEWMGSIASLILMLVPPVNGLFWLVRAVKIKRNRYNPQNGRR